jgi:dienelactone hydrolase
MSASEKRTIMLAAWIGGGVLVLLVLAMVITSLLSSGDSGDIEAASSSDDSSEEAANEAGGADPTALFPIASVPLPEFPELSPSETSSTTLSPSGVKVYFAHAKPPEGTSAGPGMSMGFRVYLPPGDHAEHSLPCVLVAPAGTTLLTGARMDMDDYHDETLPYVEAGMVVIFYGLDGHVPAAAENSSEAAYVAAIGKAYPKFKAACAGLVNGRNALEFALAKIPQVDPDRIYTAGHSSAGTLSLLLAEHEPRIKRCIAYAPCTDIEERLADAVADPYTRQLLSGLADFLKRSSPRTHTKQLKCPVFIFHARDDSNVPFSESTAFVKLLQSSNSNVTFAETASGNHYDSMVKEGIPRAIKWLASE